MGGKQGRPLNPSSLKQLREQVDFSDEEIQLWYQEYKNSLSNGRSELTKKEFMAVYNSLFVGDASSFAEQVFRSFDTDGSGTVNFQEFLVGLCVSGSSNLDAKLQWAFTVYDINGDGFISKDEILHIVEAIYRMTEHTEEAPSRLAESLFHQFDFDRDGKISWHEFRKGAEHNTLIIDLLQVAPDHDET